MASLLFLYTAVGIEKRQRGQGDDVVPVLGVALREDRHLACNYAARALHELLHRVQALSRGDDVVHDEDLLALYHLRVRRVDDQLLYVHRRDGAHLDLKNARHIGLRALAGQEILLRARLARHLIKQGNGLGFGGDEVIVLRRALQKLRRAVDRELDIPEHDEGADIELVSHAAKRQFALESGDVHLVCHFHSSQRNCVDRA